MQHSFGKRPPPYIDGQLSTAREGQYAVVKIGGDLDINGEINVEEYSIPQGQEVR